MSVKNSADKESIHALTLTKRIQLVLETHQRLGYVNRKALIESYGITQQEAGSLMRDFIHAHARDLEWNARSSHYEMKANS